MIAVDAPRTCCILRFIRLRSMRFASRRCSRPSGSLRAPPQRISCHVAHISRIKHLSQPTKRKSRQARRRAPLPSPCDVRHRAAHAAHPAHPSHAGEPCARQSRRDSSETTTSAGRAGSLGMHAYRLRWPHPEASRPFPACGHFDDRVHCKAAAVLPPEAQPWCLLATKSRVTQGCSKSLQLAVGSVAS